MANRNIDELLKAVTTQSASDIRPAREAAWMKILKPKMHNVLTAFGCVELHRVAPFFGVSFGDWLVYAGTAPLLPPREKMSLTNLQVHGASSRWKVLGGSFETFTSAFRVFLETLEGWPEVFLDVLEALGGCREALLKTSRGAIARKCLANMTWCDSWVILEGCENT